MAEPKGQVRIISKELAKRLFPLALAICFLITFLIPGLYYFFEYRKLKGEAETYSKQLSSDIKALVATSPDLWKYQATKYSQIIDSFIPHKHVLSITILDEHAIPINQYSHTSSVDFPFKFLGIHGAPAPIMFNNHKIGEILISVSADSTIITTGLIFIICLLVGIPLSLIIYRLPLRIVTRLEAQLLDYQQTLEDKAKLEELNRQLQKTDSLTRMAGAIAHHFNNQLGVVIGNLEMAIDDLPKGEKPAERLAVAMQGARKAAEVSGLMLTYLGQTTGKHDRLDLSETCRQCLPLIQAAIPKGLDLKIDIPSAGPVIRANANQIQQVLTNLVTNAWEAAKENQGTVGLIIKTVSLADISTAHRFPINWQSQDKTYACLEVWDTGCGITDEDIDKIFDPFYSSKFTGRGLGLSVVLGIIKAHGGAITLESTTGQGSTFRVFLPVSGEAALQQPKNTAQPVAREENVTVLLVEDEELVRNMTATMLTRLGFMVLAAKDGIEAVEVFEKHLNEIRVVMCDLTMPHMNGWETLAALRRIRPDIPFILASGYDEAQVLVGEHPELPQVFLHKPYQKVELLDALAKTISGLR